MTILIPYLLLGILIGTLSGLFGIGGGVIMVPALILSLSYSGFEENTAIYLATRTSLAIILITSTSSAYNHSKKGGIDIKIVKEIGIFVILGTIFGAMIASAIKPQTLKLLFIIYVTFISLKMWFGFRPKPESDHHTHPILNAIVGLIIGLKSAVLGIGGGTISIPYLTWRGIKIQKAVGVSATLGAIIALFGTISGFFIEANFNESNLKNVLANIYWPAFVGIGATSLFFTRLGAHIAYKLPQDKMRKIFAFFLFLVAMRGIYQKLF